MAHQKKYYLINFILIIKHFKDSLKFYLLCNNFIIQLKFNFVLTHLN